MQPLRTPGIVVVLTGLPMICRRDRIDVGFTTTCAISDYHHWSCEFEPHSLQGVLDTTFVIKFVSDLQQVGGFLRVLYCFHQ